MRRYLSYQNHLNFYPLAFHKNAPAMTEWIMQGVDDKEKHERAEAIMLNSSLEYKHMLDKKKPFNYSDAINLSLNKGKNAARVLRVTGSLTIFDSKFHKLNWGTLLHKERMKKEKMAMR